MDRIAKQIFSWQPYGKPREKRGSEITATLTTQRDGSGFKMVSRCGRWKFKTASCNNSGLSYAAIAAKESYEKFYMLKKKLNNHRPAASHPSSRALNETLLGRFN